jgi:hypothetical protein
MRELSETASKFLDLIETPQEVDLRTARRATMRRVKATILKIMGPFSSLGSASQDSWKDKGLNGYEYRLDLNEGSDFYEVVREVLESAAREGWHINADGSSGSADGKPTSRNSHHYSVADGSTYPHTPGRDHRTAIRIDVYNWPEGPLFAPPRREIRLLFTM